MVEGKYRIVSYRMDGRTLSALLGFAVVWCVGGRFFLLGLGCCGESEGDIEQISPQGRYIEPGSVHDTFF